MSRPKKEGHKAKSGFTLLEVVIGMGLMAVAILGLAQMFTLAVMNNFRSDRITTSSFLAQQRVDSLRNLTQEELTIFAAGNGIDLNGDGTDDLLKDELININSDRLTDFRRITDLQSLGTSGAAWQVRILVVSAEEFDTDRSELLQNPGNHRIRALVSTIINR